MSAKFVKLYERNNPPALIAEIADMLRDGKLVIYPTDTVYGLGAALSKPRAIEKLAQIKGIKPQEARFSLLFHSLSQMSEFIKQLDTPTFKIIKKATPGPYTFILPALTRLPKILHKRKTIGFRIPDNPILLEILEELGEPLVNISIKDEQDADEYTTDPELIYEKWKNRVDLIVDGGILEKTPSTVIDLTGDVPEVIREGKGPVDFLF